MAQGLVDNRTVGKLATFDGKDESWSDWSFRAASWFALMPTPPGLTVSIASLMEAARDEPAAASLTRASYGPLVDETSVMVYNVLVQATEGKAFKVIRAQEKAQRISGVERASRRVRA